MFMLDSAMLPSVNYISLMLDDDSDLSADADAFAMKYLSDEQLSELARIRLHSPKLSRTRRRDAAFGRMVNSGANSNNTSDVSTYGLPANHVSFATKKFMEKYGLATGKHQNLDAETGAQQIVDTSYEAVPKVRDFLNRLMNDKEKNNSSLINFDSHTPQEQQSVISDTTVYRTPNKSPVRPCHSKEKASSDHTPIRVFGDSFRRKHPIRPRLAETKQADQKVLNPKLKDSRGNVAPNQILDIKRLKELPKLL